LPVCLKTGTKIFNILRKVYNFFLWDTIKGQSEGKKLCFMGYKTP
jgi:hypothetical protein